LQIYKIYATNQLILIYFYQRDNVFLNWQELFVIKFNSIYSTNIYTTNLTITIKIQQNNKTLLQCRQKKIKFNPINSINIYTTNLTITIKIQQAQ
jgi:hypothetical protein